MGTLAQGLQLTLAPGGSKSAYRIYPYSPRLKIVFCIIHNMVLFVRTIDMACCQTQGEMSSARCAKNPSKNKNYSQ